MVSTRIHTTKLRGCVIYKDANLVAILRKEYGYIDKDGIQRETTKVHIRSDPKPETFTVFSM